jgi:hypothetical protein
VSIGEGIDWPGEVERLALQIPVTHHGVRLDVLSVHESVVRVTRVVEGVEE